MRSHQFILFALFLLVCGINQAQTNKKNNIANKVYLKVAYQEGYIFPTNTFLQYNNQEQEHIDEFRALSLAVGIQTKGRKEWQQRYGYPYWGMGIQFMDFEENRPELGNPIVLYGFFLAPFFRKNKWAWNYQVKLGYGFNWQAYHPTDNPNNISLGAKHSIFIELGSSLQYQMLPQLAIEIGGTLTHFSNGALKQPNFGINMLAPNISLCYKPTAISTPFIEKNYPNFKQKYEWTIATYAGVKNILFDSLAITVDDQREGLFYPILGLTTAIHKQISYKSKFGIGVSMSYDGGHHAQAIIEEEELEEVDIPINRQLQISIYPSYELVMGKWGVIVQPGFYLYRNKHLHTLPKFYQRLGIKYHVLNHWFVAMNLRAHSFHVSDFIEWTIGYRL